MALLAALALTLLLTIAIGAILTRQQVDRSQASALARQADSAAAARRASQPTIGSRTSCRAASRRSSVSGRASPSTCRTSAGRATAPRPTTGRRISTRTGRSRRAGCSCCGRRARGRRPGIRFSATCCSPRSPARRSRRCSRSWSRARSCGRCGGWPTASHALAAGETPKPLPEEGARELASLAQAFNEMAEQLASVTRERAELPALGQPRAEDAAHRDPRLRRGPRRGSVHAGGGVADDPRRVAPARAARARPARSRADEPARVLGLARAREPRGRRPRRRLPGTKRRPASSALLLRRKATSRGSRPITTGCSRWSRT